MALMSTERQNNLRLRAKERIVVPFDARDGDVRMVLAYPNRYWIAMSNLGFQTVFKLFSEAPRMNAERAFIPEDDEAQIRSFESDRALSDCEILALSVSFETDYPNVLRMIEAAGVDLKARLAGEDGTTGGRPRPLVVGGGAALTLNPEPLAPFFDAIVIGEGEKLIDQITAAYISARDRGQDFEQLLLSLAQIDGVYVPSFYEVAYNSDDTISGFSAKSGAPARVERQYLAEINYSSATTVIQTDETEFRSMFMTETGRGCEVGCRFCVAGYMYRPVRKRSAELLSETVKIGIENSASVGFVGAAVSSHPQIAELASSVAAAGKRAALSSIMSQRVSPKLASSLSESEYKTVALAPEAGSEQLRFRVGKRVPDERILHAVRTLAREGIRNFKMYFIVGLPSETEADVLAIPALVQRARDAAIEAAREGGDFKIAPTILLSVNPFIPKAWTPFQRHPFLGFAAIKKRISEVESRVRRIPNVEMKHESPRESYFQALMSRGDRRVAAVLLHLHQNGLEWKQVCRNGGERMVDQTPPADFYVLRQPAQNEILPWEIVDLRIKRSLLEREYGRTFNEDVSGQIARARAELQTELGPGLAD